MSSEFHDRLFQVAMAKGYLTEEGMHAALRMFGGESKGGKPTRLEEVLVDEKLLTREQLVDVRRTMAKEGVHVRLGDDLEILSRIGRGSIGTVYLARQRSIGRKVAVKVLASHLASDVQFVGRFLREARMAARMNHPNLVQVYDVGQWRGTHYIVMEHVAGQALEQLLEGGRRLSESQAVHIGAQLAEALRHASGRGVIHRDIKPGNIILTADGSVKLADLGLATSADEEAEDNVGTPYYMSPEQARNDPEIDVRSDIYALGCTLYHAVTGRPPFQGRSAAETMRMHVDCPAPNAIMVRPELSEKFCATLLRMMAKDPAGRFADADELLSALSGVDVPPPAKIRIAKDREPLSLRAWVLILIILAIIMFSAAIVARRMRLRLNPVPRPRPAWMQPRSSVAVTGPVNLGALR